MLYYIQSKERGYVGNNIVWWGVKSQGYTCHLDKAGKYTEAEATKIVQEARGDEIAFPVEMIDLIATRQVDMQYIPEAKQNHTIIEYKKEAWENHG